MGALLYLTKRTFLNNLKKALKKPVTFLYLILGAAYAVMLIYGFGVLAYKGNFATEKGIIYVLTVWIYLAFCSNFISYAKLKGVIFKPSHSHFIFPAPISSKVILLHGAVKNFAVSLLMDVAITVMAVTAFGMSVGKALLLFLFLFVFEVAFESSLIVFLYAKEERFEVLVKVLCKCIYLVLLSILVVILLYLRKNGVTGASIKGIFDLPALQMIPVVGWNIAALRLIVLGPTLLNSIGTVLYIISCLGMLLTAWKMKCDGAYYEDGAKFADDYAELRARSKKGETSISIGKKKKLRNAEVEYKGTGAKAIFYRQLLEYKKEKYFIFGAMTVYSVIAVVICIAFIGRPDKLPPGVYLLGVTAYLVFLCTGYLGKWAKELASPYLYLIPDTPVRKLWYATVMEHVKALIDGVIFAFPIGIAWNVPVYQIAAVILIYVVLQANRLYVKILSESILGNTLGVTGKNIFSMLVQGGVIGIGVAIAAVLGILINFNLVFLIIPIYSMMVTALIACLTASRFGTMEQWD